MDFVPGAKLARGSRLGMLRPLRRAGRILGGLSAALLVVAAAGVARAEEWPEQLGKVKLVVADPTGPPDAKPAEVAQAARRALSEIVLLLPTESFRSSKTRRQLRGWRAELPQNIARAGREIGARYVLTLAVRRQGWLYTARAIVIDTESGESIMDFRAQYYNPATEAADRGTRIGIRTLQKLASIVAPGQTPPEEETIEPDSYDLEVSSATVSTPDVPTATGAVALGPDEAPLSPDEPPADEFPAAEEPSPISLELGGYVRSFNGVQFPAVKHAPESLALPDRLGSSTNILRLEWKLGYRELLTFQLHQRLLSRVVTEAQALGGQQAGASVTTPPDRTLDLRLLLVDRPNILVEHDLDRLSLQLYAGPLELTVGRQAISWGNSLIFTVADLWTSFSPFEVDTSQKRGVDALRGVITIGSEFGLDIVVADRGELRDLSAGVLGNAYLPFGDLHLGAGKFWNELVVIAGVASQLDAVKLRGEVAVPFLLREDRAATAGCTSPPCPRATVGIDWLPSIDLILGVEGHYNGTGVSSAGDYAELAATSETIARGETYLLGKWYAGLVARYSPHELVKLSLTANINLVDPSALLNWSAAYEMAQDVELSLGGFHGIGKPPIFNPAPVTRSELGSFGQLTYLQIALFL